MFDRQRLRDNTVALFIVGSVTGLAGNQTAAFLSIGVGLLTLCLFTSMKPSVLPRVTRDIFEVNLNVNEFKAMMKNDADFHQAVSYVYNLSSDDFIRFCRLVAEVRDHSNQRALRDVADLCRRTIKEEK